MVMEKFIKRGQALPVQVLPQFFSSNSTTLKKHLVTSCALCPIDIKILYAPAVESSASSDGGSHLSKKSRVALVGVQRHEQELSGGGDCSSGGGQRQGAL